MRSVAVVGSGWSGAVVGRAFASLGVTVDVFEARDHIGGNCHTALRSGTTIHTYGPHIFHTDLQIVRDFMESWTDFFAYEHRVKAATSKGLFSLPINLHTICQLEGRVLSPDEARDAMKKRRVHRSGTSFEDYLIRNLGNEIYELFFQNYTRKQWGRHPSELPDSIAKRLPIRFDFNDSYFHHKFQGIPVGGYTAIFEHLLDHKNVNLHLSTKVEKNALSADYDKVIWTGGLDVYFDYQAGILPYRTLDFEWFDYDGDWQGCAQLNHCSGNVEFTRTTEYQHFEPVQERAKSVISREFSREAGANDEPYYPIRLNSDESTFQSYLELASGEKNTAFVGRLASFRYLDMDQTIYDALSFSTKSAQLLKNDLFLHGVWGPDSDAYRAGLSSEEEVWIRNGLFGKT